MLIKAIFLISLLLIFVEAYQILQQAYSPLNMRPFGDFKPEINDIPRAFICGVGVWRKTMVGTQKQVCFRTTFGTNCLPSGTVTLWTRVNGIKFAFCDSADWTNRTQLEDIEGENWEGMKYCPTNQLVSGFRAKLTDRDGLAGLIIICRDISQRLVTSEILIFDGVGPWGNPQLSSNFAIGFRTQRNVNYITGLSLSMMGIPQINEIKIIYSNIDKFDIYPNYTQDDTFSNHMFDPVQLNFSFSTDILLKYGWYSNGNWNAGSLQNRMSSQMHHKRAIQVPYISNDLKQIVSRNASIKDIIFGTQISETLHLTKTTQILIPNCMKAFIFGTQYLSEVEIPFEMRISETISGKTQWRTVNGKFKGVISSDIRINYRLIDINC